MSIITRCDNCGKRYSLESKLLGKKIRCKECGEAFAVSPDVATKRAGSRRFEDDLEDDPPRRGRRDRQGRSNTGWIMTAIGGGAALIVAIVVVAVLAMSRDEQNNAQAGGPAKNDSGKSTDFLPRVPITPPGKDGGNTFVPPGKDGGNPPPPLVEDSSQADPPLPPVNSSLVDPPAGAIKWPANLQGQWTIKTATNPLLFRDNPEVFLPSMPGPYAAWGNFSKPGEALELVNLTTGKVESALEGTTGFRLMSGNVAALSPTGGFFAVTTKDNKSVEVWSFKTKQKVQTINPDWGPGARSDAINHLDFTSSGKLLTVRRSQEGRRSAWLLELWDVNSGDRLAEYREPRAVVFEKAVSPGGRLLAMVTHDSTTGLDPAIEFFDRETLRPVGKINVPHPPQGMSFSPDGAELATLTHRPGFPPTYTLASIDLRTKQNKVNHSQSGDLFHKAGNRRNKEPKMLWLPDRSGWVLLGCMIFDYQSGAARWESPPIESMDWPVRRPLQGNVFLQVRAPNLMVRVAPLPGGKQ